jgi:hypothetical protein
MIIKEEGMRSPLFVAAMTCDDAAWGASHFDLHGSFFLNKFAIPKKAQIHIINIIL